jgi:hypothetical protein
MMFVGITLFFRLAQAAFRPSGKVLHPAPSAVFSVTSPTPSTAKRAGRC